MVTVAPVEKTIMGRSSGRIAVSIWNSRESGYPALRKRRYWVSLEENLLPAESMGGISHYLVAYQLCHLSIGMNPRAELTGWTTEDDVFLELRQWDLAVKIQNGVGQ